MEAKQCRAQTMENCPFSDNPHFETKEEAIQESEKQLTAALGILSTLTKQPESYTEFYGSLRTQKTLINYLKFPVSSLPHHESSTTQ